MTNNAEIKDEDSFYSNAREYWSEIPATVDGMLGGYGHISQIDIQGSRQFLKLLNQGANKLGTGYALDCGAGIGRITKNLLTTVFDKVDLVEQNPAFLEQGKKYLESKLERIGEFYPVGLQAFEPEEDKYDVIWAQWVLGHLTEEDFIKFLFKCKKGLKKKGILIIKENITSSGTEEVDDNDSSVTRPFSAYIEMFKKGEFDCFRKMKQQLFPKNLYSVYMFALRPNVSNSIEDTNADC